MEDYYVGVDVGTGSVRVALVTSHGKIKNVSVCKTTTNNPEFEYYEQSSTEIWASICMCVKVKKSFLFGNFKNIPSLLNISYLVFFRKLQVILKKN